MANRDNHYEAAFEEYLRSRGVPYVAVDEAKRSVLSSGGSIKSLDFIVSSPGPVSWLVDVKGRKFPSGESRSNTGRTGQLATTWSAWPNGSGCSGRAFAGCSFSPTTSWEAGPRCLTSSFSSSPANRLYAFVAVRLMDYAGHARPISAKWDTLAMPAADFRRLARPLDELLGLTEKQGE